MQTEQLEKQNWLSLSGRILEGGFELKDLIEADETRALFRVRVLGDRELVATALFRRADPTSADRQVELWQTVRELRDEIRGGGRDHDGVRIARQLDVRHVVGEARIPQVRHHGGRAAPWPVESLDDGCRPVSARRAPRTRLGGLPGLVNGCVRFPFS